MAELKPCPFCGGEAEIGYTRSCYNHWKPEGYFPRCKDTKCIGRVYRKYHTERAAIEAWNKRTERPKGRWVETDEYPDDAYWHHKCSNCGAFAQFDYETEEDWEEGFDGEMYSMGHIDVGINEHLTPFCPNCGDDMRGALDG